MSDSSDIADMRNALKGKMSNAVLLLNDADSFLWLRQEGHHDANPFLGGGNWLILLGALSVLNLLGKISFISDERLGRCDVAWFSGKRARTDKMGNCNVSETEGFVNLCQLGTWNISDDEARKFWQENRNPLTHLGYPRMGAGVVGRELGSYMETVQKVKDADCGDLFFKLPSSIFPNLSPEQIPIFANSDLLVQATRNLVPALGLLVERGSDADIEKVFLWCSG
jgi:hypothetical protein